MQNKTKQTDLDLITLQINTLFHTDTTGRLLAVNEFGEPPAPRFFLGRTRQGNVWRFRHDLSAPLATALDALCRAEPLAEDLTSPPQQYAAIKALLQTDAPIQAEYRGPCWWIPEGTQPAANVVLIDQTNLHLLASSFPWVQREEAYATGPVAATLEQGQGVAICFCSRYPGQATEAGVETLPAFRGKGYATAAVAAWAAAVHQRGVLPLYSTSWENLASQAIARKLGMVFYGENWSLG